MATSPSLATQQLQLGVDSLYVSEGRNNLVSGGLGWISYDVSAAGINFGIWYAEGTGADYQETQFALGYTHAWTESLNLSAGINTVDAVDRTLADADIELSAAVTFTRGKFESLIEAVYSRQFNGAYFTLAQSVEVHPTTRAFVRLGNNAGYVQGESRGPNNLDLGLTSSRQIVGNSLAINWQISQTIALGARPRDTLGDHLWVSISLKAQF
ncbi:MAG: hypothetical protein ACFHX7_24395 [Pseudomonadota bacterium]